MKKIIITLVLAITAFSCGGSNTNNEKVAYYNAVAEGRSFDPQLITDGFTMGIHGFLTEGLTETKPNGTVIPRQAESWTVSEDGLTWTFKLRDDIKWSDGSKVVADDFVYAWQRALSPALASEYSFILFPIKNAEKYNKGEVSVDELGVKALDDKTLEVKLENVTPYFDSLVSFITYMPAKRSFVEKQGDEYALEKENLLYNGPFVVSDWKRGDKMELVKNQQYYGKDEIKLDKIIVKYIKDESSALNAFNNGELDFVKLNTEDAERLSKDERLVEINQARTVYITYNTTNNIFKNENMRKAISLAIDKEKLVNLVFNNLKDPLYTFTPKGSGIVGIKEDFSTEMGNIYPTFNKEMAKQYLEKGLKELSLSKAPKITFLVDDRYSFNRKIGEAIQEEIRTNLGLDIDVEVVTFKERLVRTRGNEYNFALVAWGADYQDPMTFLDLLASYNGNNAAHFNDPNYDKLIELATKSVDRKDRIKYLKEAELYLVQKMPILPLYQEKLYYIINPKLKGLELSSFAPDIRISRADKVK